LLRSGPPSRLPEAVQISRTVQYALDADLARKSAEEIK
jgi:hypothetical protein